MFTDGSKFRKQFLKRNNPVKLFQILISSFWGEKFWRISVSAKSLSPPHGGHVFQQIEISQTIFEKGTKEQSCKIISKSYQQFQRRRILKNFSQVYTVQKVSPPTAAMFFDRSKFHKQFLKRVTQGTILWNYSKFWPAVSEEKIFKEFLQVHKGQKPPPPMVAMFFDRSKFREQFLKRVTQGTILWNYFKIEPVVSEKKIFKEFLHVGIVLKVFPSTAAMFFNGSKFHEHFFKTVTQGTILWNYFKIGPAVSEEKIFKEFLKKFHLVAMAIKSFLWNQILQTIF